MNKKDNINPSHYKNGKIECIDALEAATVGKTGIEAVCTANVIKYLWRYEDKNGVEDVQKAVWYINKLMNVLTDRQLKGDAVNSNIKTESWTKEASSVPITLIGTYEQDNHIHDVYYVDADVKEGDPVSVEKFDGCGGTIQYKYRNDADNKGKLEAFREVKDGITHIHYYVNRPIRQGDGMGGAVGINNDKGEYVTELHHYTYKSS